MSPNPNPGPWEPKSFGETVADHVIALARSVKTETPAHPSVKGMVDTFHFKTRVDLKNPLVAAMFSSGPFSRKSPATTSRLYGDGLTAELNTVLLNGELALVGGSGEFFCNHANRLKARSYVKHTLFFGYCNGHGMYFPTIEAASEGGYGADRRRLPGRARRTGERMMDKALLNIYLLQGKFARESRVVRPDERTCANVSEFDSDA